MKKFKVIAIAHLTPFLNVGISKKIPLKNGNWTRFNDSNQFWFFALGNQLMDRFSNILDFEIWQPETNIESAFCREYPNGLVYRLIQANFINEWTLTGTKQRLFSQEIMDLIDTEVEKNPNLVLFFRGTREYLLNKIVNNFYGRVPFVGMFSIHISGELLIDHFWKHPFAETYHYFFGLRPYKIFLLKISNIVPSTQNDLKAIPFFKKLNVLYRDNFSAWGIDTVFWKRSENYAELRLKYHIKENEKVILISSRIVEEKQVKEMIEALGNFRNEKFHLIITGNLKKNKYVDEVRELTDGLLTGKVTLTGYISDEELRDIYSISDLMLSYSISEGGPFSIFQAYLMEVPVIQSSVGIAAEMAKKYNISKLVKPNKPEELIDAITDFFSGKKPLIISREIATSYFSHEIVSEYYYNVFNHVINSNLLNK